MIHKGTGFIFFYNPVKSSGFYHTSKNPLFLSIWKNLVVYRITGISYLVEGRGSRSERWIRTGARTHTRQQTDYMYSNIRICIVSDDGRAQYATSNTVTQARNERARCRNARREAAQTRTSMRMRAHKYNSNNIRIF